MLEFIKSKAIHLVRGELAEKQALVYLLSQGLTLVSKNYRCKHGELDLIMKDNNTLVIVEVRFRKTNKYGSALETITSAKQSRIINTTHIYLSELGENQSIRFDVVAISGDGTIEWIKNAF